MPQHGGHNKIELKDSDYAEIETMAGIRLPIEKIACIKGFSKATFERMMKRDKRLAAAVEQGKAKASAKVFQSLYKQATSEKNFAATAFWMKTQEGVREVQRLELTGENGEPLVPKDQNREALEAELAKIRALREKLGG